MEREGIVIEDKGDTAVVVIKRHLSCESCGGCGILSKSRQDHTLEATNTVKAKIGQRVYIETDDRQMLFVLFMLYMVPLFALVGGIVGWLHLGAFLGFEGREMPALVAGFALMALVFAGIRRWDRRVKKTGRYRPVITGVAEESEPV